MKISEIQNGQAVRYRLGKHGRTKIKWRQWTWGPMSVQRMANGVAVSITPMNEAWAEYDPRKHSGNFLDAEEFCMEIDLEASQAT